MSTPDSWHPFLTQTPLDDAIRMHYAADEANCLNALLPDATPNPVTLEKVRALTIDLIAAARKPNEKTFSVESFLQEYGLDTHEGLMLMCLAEALLRIPDNETAQLFIEDKITHDNWEKHLGHSQSFWVNASTWGLVVASNLFKETPQPLEHQSVFKRVVQKLGEPIAVKAIKRAMQIMGGQFVAGTNIEEAVRNNAAEVARGYWHSYDMLGEAAINETEAKNYLDAYAHAIETIAKTHRENNQQASISIKLSALHARFEPRKLAARELIADRVAGLIELARERNVMVTIDAEESWRLESTLAIFASVIGRLRAEYQAGIGIAVQAYQKRAPYVIHWLNELAQKHNTRIPVRLVKGAYWDAEIKYTQQLGHENYPVYTRKVNTDIAYLACARRLMKAEHLDPQFATHNAHTVASLLYLREEYPNKPFEFQRLHGMGESLYSHVLEKFSGTRCRVYAPVGSYRDLLAYLVRRLLKNGANTSFVRLVQTVDSSTTLAQEPVVVFNALAQASHPKIAPPPKLYTDRANSRGLNLEAEHDFRLLLKNLDAFITREYHATALSSAVMQPERNPHPVYAPANNTKAIGTVTEASAGDVLHALNQAQEYFPRWAATPVIERAQCLHKMADLLEQHRYELIALLIQEGGKTMQNAIAEIREAADFCRYYAVQAVKVFSQPELLQGPTGEENTLYWEGRGVFACISPWNFPLAIYVGQIAAALAAGNCVLAKPSQRSCLLGYRAAELFHLAGIPKQALHYLPTSSAIFSRIFADSRIAGVAFTGSNRSAQQINEALAKRHGPIVPFIAETGGQNAMIADSTALPEQIVRDVMISAFDSAGQRCSALRVLFLQEDIADRVLDMLKGALHEIKIGDPIEPDTDIGPVIDKAALEALKHHVNFLQTHGELIGHADVPAAASSQGYFFPPQIFQIAHLSSLKEEVFGPILHVIRFANDKLDDVLDQINATGYGLTLGIHTRIDERAQLISQQLRVGNVYINRNMIGATVGVQPFGGQGLSGTGPKAGGPHYLQRFANEKTITKNLSAIGGNIKLINEWEQ